MLIRDLIPETDRDSFSAVAEDLLQLDVSDDTMNTLRSMIQNVQATVTGLTGAPWSERFDTEQQLGSLKRLEELVRNQMDSGSLLSQRDMEEAMRITCLIVAIEARATPLFTENARQRVAEVFKMPIEKVTDQFIDAKLAELKELDGASI